MYEIIVGSLDDPLFKFDDGNTYEISTTQGTALVGQELSIDVFEPLVADHSAWSIYHFRSSEGHEIETSTGATYVIDKTPCESDLVLVPEGTPLWYYQSGNLIGKFYIKNVERRGRNKYKINAVSAIGRLDTMYHGGGIYDGSQTFKDVLDEILSPRLYPDPFWEQGDEPEPVIHYAIDDDVSTLRVSGWLPYDTKRNNLYKLIFANGVNIVRNADGDPRFTFIYGTQGENAPIETADIFDVGEVDYEKPYSSVTIQEHTYIADTTVDFETVFDNTDAATPANNELVFFNNAPIIPGEQNIDYDSSIIPFYIGPNFAVISGRGKIMAKPFTHTTREVTKNHSGGDQTKKISVKDCTLVSVINSQNLLDRLFSFYCPRNYIKHIRNEIVFNEQRCGKVYSFLSPFEDQENAFLAKMAINASSFNRASCDFYANYEPQGQAGLYHHVIILDRTTMAEDGGTFTLPAEALAAGQIKVVMIGGGTGGSSGWPGQNGEDSSGDTGASMETDISGIWYGAEGGDGGDGGDGGSPGRVKAVVIDNPASNYSYSIGVGGAGGAPTGYIRDTRDEIIAALKSENPDSTPSDSDVQRYMNIEAAQSDWSGTPNEGSAGTATTFGSYSTAQQDASVPEAGVYDPINGVFYALPGNKGTPGGKGGARQVGNGELYTWVTDGEDVTGFDGTVFRGGRTGLPVETDASLPEARFTIYGGNGAGAAVGLTAVEGMGQNETQIPTVINEHMDGSSDGYLTWTVVENGNGE